MAGTHPCLYCGLPMASYNSRPFCYACDLRIQQFKNQQFVNSIASSYSQVMIEEDDWKEEARKKVRKDVKKSGPTIGLAELILLTQPEAGEDNISPANLPALCEEDFERVISHIVNIMQAIKDRYTDPLRGVYRYNFSIFNEEEEVPKAIITHDAKLDAYDIKFDSGTERNRGWQAIMGVIGILKATVPVSDRTYEPNLKQWTVTSKYYPPLEELLRNLNFTIEVQKDIREDFFYDSAPITTVVSKATLQNKLQILLEVSSEVFKDSDALKRAYRKKALAWHPDRNSGDGSRMSELNSLWSQYNAN